MLAADLTKGRNISISAGGSQHLLGPSEPRNLLLFKNGSGLLQGKTALRTSHVAWRLKVSQAHEPTLCFITQVCSWHEPTLFTTINQTSEKAEFSQKV